MRRKYAKIRICQRGKRDKYPNQHIDGDLLNTNNTYKKLLHFVVDWEPAKNIKKFVDKYCPDYVDKMIKDNIEVTLYYPLDIEDLVIYLEENALVCLDKETRCHIIDNDDISKLIEEYEGLKNVLK